jgi:hypothetical protein
MNHDDNLADLSPPPPENDDISALSSSPGNPTHDDNSEGFPWDFDEEDDDIISEGIMSYVAAAPPRVQALAPPVQHNGLPTLGSSHPWPLEQSLGQFPVLYDDALALLELHRILSKRGCTQCCFDYVVEWLEQHISAGTFSKNGKLLHHQALMSGLTSKFPMPPPPHRMVTVTLETGTENVEHPDDYVHGKAMKVPIWDIQDILTHYLLDLTLFHNKDNLINTDDPFSKFAIDNPNESKEYLAGQPSLLQNV